MNAIVKPGHLFNLVWISILLLALLSGSVVDPTGGQEPIRAFSRPYEFDSLSWTISALARKLAQSSLDVEDYLSTEEQRDLVYRYLDLKNQAYQLESQLTWVISDPDQTDRQERETAVRQELERVDSERDTLAPFMEQAMQSQLDNALADLDMSLGGQLVPPVLFRSEPNSYALIVSPRDEIRQEANIMLVRGLTLDQITDLESSIEDSLDLSALVVGIGGVGLYPSMIIESGNLDWLIHVTAHEWTHNFLTLRPLGLAYSSSPDLTTINETIADLSADAIQAMTFQLYYPEYLPPEPPPPSEETKTEPAASESQPEPEEAGPPPFDFREQMHITRLEVDRLLAEGRIAEAEAYMDQRRIFFWDNGYQIRRLNQAYFAFHGSYAAEPGGAAGQEGVDLGAELRDLRSRAPSYRAFMRQVAWKWRLDQFQALFNQVE
ncbi:MAG: hypothetical protein ACK2TZ_00345 [Anaerolineales bacterium]|jgi:hypothetical protein